MNITQINAYTVIKMQWLVSSVMCCLVHGDLGKSGSTNIVPAADKSVHLLQDKCRYIDDNHKKHIPKGFVDRSEPANIRAR